MSPSGFATTETRTPNCEPFAHRDVMFQAGMLKLLAIKDSDIRILTLGQSGDAIDRGFHAGGAFSAILPLVALFYGGFLRLDIADPTRLGQDMFTLSKGHAVAALASIYAEIGYFDEKILRNSRSYESLLNGHPGPILPGVQIATGPMGQGIGVAQGFAIAGKGNPRFDSYCMVGDGELQEGSCWEAVMYAAQHGLDNFCVLVDRNNGQLDIHDRMLYPMPPLEEVFRSFGWNTHNVDATQYDGIFSALNAFRFGVRSGKPTAILCNTRKGFGAFSNFFNKHKVTVPTTALAQELLLQQQRRVARVEEFRAFLDEFPESSDGVATRELLLNEAERMHLSTDHSLGESFLEQVIGPLLTKRAPRRDKKIQYEAAALPRLDKSKTYSAAEIVTAGMKVFAQSSHVVSIDSDLASTSGLEAGTGSVDQARALNVGVAEANMMLISEAFAALGYNTWCSTFCPFFNWQVLRRIAVGHQERLETIAATDGWLNEGHGLDITFLATAANFETRTNGATHMGNDDATTFDAVAHLKIIDVSCPQQMLSIMKWIMDGNKGLVYLRVMRTGSAVLYEDDYQFEYGMGYTLRESDNDCAIVISSGRGVHEALGAADICAREGINITVVDMPSIDGELLMKLYRTGLPMVFAEQNNGYLWQNFLKVLYRHQADVKLSGLSKIFSINTLDVNGNKQFLHSATYEELIDVFDLTPAAISSAIQKQLRS
ncbi:transketolase C-terminal domain-containing protein [Edaphobacter albus]|uniref:transketolase C-terminal domain-containing protein n=1 Tax=Edaphobacter sp. 4G125 TaxID=2763071 RepID=UPI001647F47B|nr:transketolase C-terminal domain-containing protein [Edaphobacter sp. 4G125]QNI36453.1 transketolase [Edaphobacter sp. 4G125]